MLITPIYQPGWQRVPVHRPTPPNPLYVDTVLGTANGTGAIDSPVNALSVAVTLCAGLPDWNIKVKAPITAPLRQENVYESSVNLLVEGVNDEPWYVYGSEVVSGWTTVGGGIYSKVITDWTLIPMGVVTTMFETVGDKQFQRKLLANTTTPTTPAAGELGYTGGVLYIHLVGDADPAAHIIEFAKRNTGMRTRGSGQLTVRDMTGRYFISAGIQNGLADNPLGTGQLVVEDCLIEYTDNNGVAAAGQNELTTCTNVKSYRCANDGFNLHATSGAQTMVLNACDGSYNGDKAGQSAQGASNHESTVLVINGGTFNNNVSGGMVVINTARCDLHGDTIHGPVVMDSNMRLGNTEGAIAGQAGCAWLDTSVGTVTGDVTVSNGQGVGVRVNAGATVTGAATIQSIGNALPDII